MLPFTRAEFLAVFADYNTAVWPAQIVAYLVALLALAALASDGRGSSRFVGGTLAAMWAWTGVAYHAFFFSAINPVALAFGVLFALQGGLLLHAVLRRQLVFGTPTGATAGMGWAFVAYAFALYPLIGRWTGHVYPATPTFGITPCPLTLFSFGLLLLTTARVPRRLLVIPLLWSLVGGSAALLLAMPQDAVLLFGGVVAVVALLLRDRRRPLRTAAAQA